ncbi:AmmeMemoRadiSam system protein B [Candidatus Sulfurimonas baltica]|uniref:MEMO1 family protein HUE88_01120 n=1 Tax=Candidatus Sulfurimonas baltica TaxID=2740404 RepID=A0A7S7LXC6_9BACT|nr:AmmeMemoRadiSam system protein B [Candidatus Sulfurimonas baltica]QOY52324.1 AmmeMemoRadiSam system protein B [Candidatus Sulfurimonas baltica]
MKREMSVAGTFYPAREVELERYFEHFSRTYDEDLVLPHVKSRAVIVPHAGYIYSGYTANVAYRILQKSGIKNFVVIGPSHRVAFEGVSLCDYKSYVTPFGEIKSADTLVEKLQENFSLSCFTQAHEEHSTEVQFPFIKHYIQDVHIIELVYSRESAKEISEIIDFVLEQEDCGVIISTDLSHFYNLEDANKLDNICLEAVKNLDLNQLHEGCEACGMIGVEAMMISAKKLGLSSHILDYRTSADASDDTDRVVGYMSACFL